MTTCQDPEFFLNMDGRTHCGEDRTRHIMSHHDRLAKEKTNARIEVNHCEQGSYSSGRIEERYDMSFLADSLKNDEILDAVNGVPDQTEDEYGQKKSCQAEHIHGKNILEIYCDG